MGRPLKVLFLLEDLCYGGTQMQNLELALRLDRNSFEPVLLTLTGPTDLDKRVTDAGIPLHHIGKDRRVAPLFFLNLGRYIKTLAPDIIVPCTALPNIWGRIWGRLKGVPVIVGTCRGGGAPRRQHERLLWRSCDSMVCNSIPLVRHMERLGVPFERLAYIPNGVDTERFSPAAKKFAPENATILNVARLAPDKDQITLLKAFAIVHTHFPDVRLRLVGEGPSEKTLKNFVERELPESAAGQVEFAGASADPAPDYREADIFALSSIREGQPNAILEAMSSGLPVCATATGGIPDLIADNGLLSEPGDAEGLAYNLLALLRSPEMAAHLGKTGRQKAESGYSFEAMVNAHQELFLQLWKRRGR